jgi:hypothetical protein
MMVVLLTGCGAKDNYLTKEDALMRGYIVLDGTVTENKNRFEVFLSNVESKREDSILVVIYDLTGSQYVISITFDGENFVASSYFMDKDSRKIREEPDLIYTDIIMSSSKNYFLIDSSKTNPDIWVYQEN